MENDRPSVGRARHVREFLDQSRQNSVPMRTWLARRAALTPGASMSPAQAELVAARQNQRDVLRRAMAVPGAINLAEKMQPGAATGGPAPLPPGAGPGATSLNPPIAVTTLGAATPSAPPAPAPTPWMTASGVTPPAGFAGFNGYGDAVDASGNPITSGPTGADRAPWLAALATMQARNADPAGFDAAQSARNDQTNAYQISRDAALGMMLPGSVGANGVDYGKAQADPSEALNRFLASGYTGQQALADGWGTGVGTPGWQSPPAAPIPASAPAPAPTSPPVPTTSVAPAAPTAPAAPVAGPSTQPAPQPSPAAPPTPSATLANAIRQSSAPATPPSAPKVRGASPAAGPTTTAIPPAGQATARPPTAAPPASNPTPRTSMPPNRPTTTFRVGLG